MRAMRVVRVGRDRLLDLRSGRRELPILGQRHGVIGEEPEIIAVMPSEAVHQLRDPALLSDPARAADEAVRVRGYGDHQRVARPCSQMRVQRGDRGLGPAREYQVEEPDVAGFALGQAGCRLLRRRQPCPCGREIALPQQHLRLAHIGQGKTRVGGDGAVISLGRAGIECQRQVGGLNVSIPRLRGRGG